MTPIRVLVVDDAVVMRRVICRALESDRELAVAGWASNGRLAIERIPQVNPDCITLDIEMPEMDGITALKEIRRNFPALPVIMFSALTRQGGMRTFEALSLGATDYVCKPSNVGNIDEAIKRLRDELAPRIKAHTRGTPAATVERTAGVQRPVHRPSHTCDIVAIATSTGGPNALAAVFQAIRKPLAVPVVIVQHMPPLFTSLLAERLDAMGGCRVREGREGDRLVPGTAYVAPGGHHMELARVNQDVCVHLNEAPPENSCRPAADVLFRSAAAIYGAGVLGVVLTGMGQDGTSGSRAIVDRGGAILAQDEASSVVWGMPGSVVGNGLANRTLSLREMPGAIVTWVQQHPGPAVRRVAS